jgi:hypothetical protein
MSADPIAVRLTHRFYRELYQTVRDACQRINPRLAPFGVRIWCGTGNSYYRIEML